MHPGVSDTGSEGGANALLIILGVGILILLLYWGRKKFLGRNSRPDNITESQDS